MWCIILLPLVLMLVFLPFGDMYRYKKSLESYRASGHSIHWEDVEARYTAGAPEGENAAPQLRVITKRLIETNRRLVEEYGNRPKKTDVRTRRSNRPLSYLPVAGWQNSPWPSFQEPFSEETMNDLVLLDATFGTPLEELVSLKGKPAHYRLNFDPENPEDLELPMFGETHFTVRFLIDWALYRAESGDLGAALDCMETVLWLGRIQSTLPIAMGTMMTSNVHSSALRTTRFMMPRYAFGEEHYVRIASMFREQEQYIDMRAGLDGEFVLREKGFLKSFETKEGGSGESASKFGSTYSDKLDATFTDNVKHWTKEFADESWGYGDKMVSWRNRAYLMSKQRFVDQQWILSQFKLIEERLDTEYENELPAELRTHQDSQIEAEHHKNAVSIVSELRGVLWHTYYQRKELALAEIEASVFRYRAKLGIWPDSLKDVEKEFDLEFGKNPFTNKSFSLYSLDDGSEAWGIGVWKPRQELGVDVEHRYQFSTDVDEPMVDESSDRKEKDASATMDALFGNEDR